MAPEIRSMRAASNWHANHIRARKPVIFRAMASDLRQRAYHVGNVASWRREEMTESRLAFYSCIINAPAPRVCHAEMKKEK